MDFSIYDTVVQAKNGDPIALNSLILLFKPLFGKYRNYVDGDDTEQELMFFLWQLLYKLPLQNDALHDNKIIFSYIAKSLKRQHVQLSKRRSKIMESEVDLPPDFALSDPHNFVERLCLTELVRQLSPSEYKLVVWIYDYGYSVKEIAAALHVSRQAVNKMKHRALKKLKEIYLRNDIYI